jgi:putative two-component system response regulator
MRSLIRAPQNSRVLVVDDDQQVVQALTKSLSAHGYLVDAASDGEAALAMIRDERPDVVLVDVILPGLNGFEVCQHLKQEPATRLLPVVLLTDISERAARIEGAKAGADDCIPKPCDLNHLHARVAALAQLKRYTDDLDSAASIISMLAGMIETRDGYSPGHCHRMANCAMAFGRRLSLGSADLQALQRGGFLHDIGMLAIPDLVLRKTSKLSPEEYELVKSHTYVGDSLCGNLRSLSPVRPIVRHHHEHLDGSGYPDGLAGAGVPLLAQIMGIVDVYDAVTTSRPYQHVVPSETAVEILRREAAIGWRSPELVEEFAAMIRHDGLTSSAVEGVTTVAVAASLVVDGDQTWAAAPIGRARVVEPAPDSDLAVPEVSLIDRPGVTDRLPPPDALEPLPVRKTVLVVDDEPSVLRLAMRVLSVENYELVSAASGAAALKKVDELGHPIDLVVTDYVMPVMDGRALVRELRRRDPSVKALYMTGFADQLFQDCVELESDTAFIEKPYSARGLVEAARLLLFGCIHYTAPAAGSR